MIPIHVHRAFYIYVPFAFAMLLSNGKLVHPGL